VNIYQNHRSMYMYCTCLVVSLVIMFSKRTFVYLHSWTAGPLDRWTSPVINVVMPYSHSLVNYNQWGKH
jgi:hypothetical protein